jgi:hypothetical protein
LYLVVTSRANEISFSLCAGDDTSSNPEAGSSDGHDFNRQLAEIQESNKKLSKHLLQVPARVPDSGEAIHYSPAEDLEDMDVQLIEKSTSDHIDIANVCLHRLRDRICDRRRSEQRQAMRSSPV